MAGKERKRTGKSGILLLAVLFLISLFIGVYAQSIIANPDGETILKAQSCSAEDNASKGSFGGLCDGAYPSACGIGGDLLSCDDGLSESHTYSRDGYAGIRINMTNRSVKYCHSITKVFLCYEWWREPSSIDGCNISVDNDGGASYYPITEVCPGTSADPGVICSNITSSDDWSCSDFFGSSATGVSIKSEAEQRGGPPSENELIWDVLFINLSYKELEIICPAHNTYTNKQPLGINISLGGSIGDEPITINYYINGILNQSSRANMTFWASEGSYTLDVSLYNGSLSSKNESINFTLDLTKPIIMLDKPEDSYENDSAEHTLVIFNGTASDSIALKNATLYHNISGAWKANKSAALSSASSCFSFTLNLTNSSFIWNVMACDNAGNCGFSGINRSATLNFTAPPEFPEITGFSPANSSVNVSEKADITAFFSMDMEEGSLNHSTFLVRDSNGSAVRGKIKYYQNDKKARFNPHRFLKNNETYTVNLSAGISSESGPSLGYDLVWNFSTRLKDTDDDGIPDSLDEDDDNDDINDTEDFLKGSPSNVKTDIGSLMIRVNRSSNLNKRFRKKAVVELLENNTLLIEFNFSFSNSSILDLTNITVQKNDEDSIGSLIISGISLDSTKTFYLDNISDYDGVCVKDAETESISNISSTCKEEHETFVRCPGSARNYNCTINGTRLKVTGLNHSAVQQADDNSPPRIDMISVSYSGTTTVSVTLTVMTDEDASCRYDVDDVSFSSMGYSMSGSSIQHSRSISYSRDTSGDYYVLCRDDFGNIMESSSSISFDAEVSEENDVVGGTGGGGTAASGQDVELNVLSLCRENWICGSWSSCKDGFQTRKCFDFSKCGTKSLKPKEFQTCDRYCEELWQCTAWSICSEGMMKRECHDLNSCRTEKQKPSEYESCEFASQCYNLVQDNGEEGIDCGGLCPPCETCYDRMQNQDEKGIDCGGSCRPCRLGDLIAATGMDIMVLPRKSPKTAYLIMMIALLLGVYLTAKLGLLKKCRVKLKGGISRKTKKKRGHSR
ncbi:Ig-like domain-containing protein [Candidatus Woesearchaeota archaeon]|nr:Ig-like domain-containing protein [Candidatus Woesearchaeota archaeon]